MLVFVRCDQPDTGSSAPVGMLLGGRSPSWPVCAFRFRGAGGNATLLVTRSGPKDSASARVAVSVGDSRADLTWAETRTAARDLFHDLAPDVLARVTRFLAGTCASTLRAHTHRPLAVLVNSLARASANDQRRLTPVMRLPDGSVVVTGAPSGARPGAAWLLVTDDAITRISDVSPPSLVLPTADPQGFVLPPDDSAPLGIDKAELLPSVAGMLKTPPAEPNLFLARLLPHLLRLADVNPAHAALVRDLHFLVPRPARVANDPRLSVEASLDLSLHDGAGVFIRGRMRDPLRQVTELRLHSPLGERRIPVSELILFNEQAQAGGAVDQKGTAAEVSGYAAYVADLVGPRMPQWHLELRLASGIGLDLLAPARRMPPAAARDLVLRALPPAMLTRPVIDTCIAPPAAHFHREALASPGLPERLVLGQPPASPIASIIVPLFRNMHFLRFQVAAFARDPEVRRAEVIYVLDSPEQRAEVEHHLRGLALVHDMPLTLLVQDINRGYASACNNGAAAAASQTLVMMNSDVLPLPDGRWLGRLVRGLSRRRDVAAAGPLLLFEDRSIQHAGLFFDRQPDTDWWNAHYWKGFPSGTVRARVAREVPAVTGAALCVRRDAFEAVGGFSTDFIIGDYEDSDLCLRLRAAGHRIRYEPGAVLFHFERRSIGMHPGYAHTAAAAFNRRLHHLRWDTAISDLMREFRPRGPL